MYCITEGDRLFVSKIRFFFEKSFGFHLLGRFPSFEAPNLVYWRPIFGDQDMRLAVNIDHVATLRNARGGNEPDPVTAAQVAELAGAEGIVCHLREDRRHIRDRDLRLLRSVVKTKLDLEMGAAEEIIGIALDVVPDLVTLVPERRQELTTEGGLDVAGQKEFLKDVVKQFHGKKIRVSLFVDPVPMQIEAARGVGADVVELHTGEYANARKERDIQECLVALEQAAKLGKSLGLGVNAGHGLNYMNTGPVASITEIDELSIGHAVITRAIFVGIERAVREMLVLVKGVPKGSE
ncbi:MAG: pyridoxine 5'-phosphate synthase [Ignavibacteriales bacterium]|nr:pyridoxine 5'-phosphate synthase [Ignavibacteriales bacterium]